MKRNSLLRIISRKFGLNPKNTQFPIQNLPQNYFFTQKPQYTKTSLSKSCSSLLRPTIRRHFAKISKKEKEKAEFKQKKSEADIPEEIDLDDLESDLQAITTQFSQKIAKLKVGSLSPEIFDEMLVTAYGDKMEVSMVAQVMPRDHSSVIIKPYDPSTVQEIGQSLRNEGQNEFDVQVNEDVIVVSVQALNTKQNRMNLVRQAKEMLEKTKVEVKKARGKKLDAIKKMAKFVGRDVVVNCEREVQEICEKNSTELGQILKKKEKELMG